MWTDLELAAGQGAVAGAQDVLQIRRRHAIFGQSLLRIIQVDLLRQHALAVNLGHFRSALDGSSHQVGEVVQFPIGVLISRDRGQASFGVCWIADERGRPTIGVNFRLMQLLDHQAIAQSPQLIIA